MQWATPEYAWLLLLLIPWFVIAKRSDLRRKQDLIHLGYVDRALTPTRIFSSAAVFLLIVMALCRPQWGFQTETVETPGIDIIIALDTSRSMLADDLIPNRLEAAKKTIVNLAQELHGDRIGLIAFAGSAFQICPLTSDYPAFIQAVNETYSDTIPKGGSNLSSIVNEVLSGFAGNDSRSRLLILVSDGEDHGGATAAAAGQLRESGIVVCSVTVGSIKGGIIPLPGGGFLKDREGNIVRSRANPGTLELFSSRNMQLDSSGVTATALYRQVRPELLEQNITNSHRLLVERFQIPLTAAFLLCLLEVFFARRNQL